MSTREPTHSDLHEELQRLREEQQRLREEHEKLRAEKRASPQANSDETKRSSEEKQEKDKKVGAQEQQSREQDEKREDAERNEEEQGPRRERIRRYLATHRKQVRIGGIVAVLLLALMIVLVLYLRSYESTDDAQVDGHLNAVSSRIGGTVAAVWVDPQQPVQQGQLMVELDPHDYQTALDQANAGYLNAEAALNAENPNVQITETTNRSEVLTRKAETDSAVAGLAAARQMYEAKAAAVRQAEANAAKAQTDLARYSPLVLKDEITHEQFDTAVAAAKTQGAGVEAARADLLAAQRAVEQSQQQVREAQFRFAETTRNSPRTLNIRQATVKSREAALLSARAQRDQAALNLSYTRIFAPVSGIVSNKTVEVGQRIDPGQQLLILTQTADIWITANFKETQLKKMHSGQAVKVHVDTFDKNYQGYVENMPGATGAVTSILPPENATGNFVKVVQRLPVRIRLYADQDPEHRLRPGMSVEPKVWINK